MCRQFLKRHVFGCAVNFSPSERLRLKLMLTYKVRSYEFAAETQACRKLLTILGSVDMCVEPAQPMDLRLMSVPMIEQLVLNCEQPQQQQQGIVLCNVRLLHKILMSECQSLPAAMSGQRSLVLEVVIIIIWPFL